MNKICMMLLLLTCDVVHSLTDAQRQEILNAHNEARSNVNNLRAQTIQKMIYDINLESVAQAWSNQCIWGHNPIRSLSGYNYVGENLAGGAFGSLKNAVKMWDNTSVCTDVWAESIKVGCGLTTNCSIGENPILVCDYYPGGKSHVIGIGLKEACAVIATGGISDGEEKFIEEDGSGDNNENPNRKTNEAIQFADDEEGDGIEEEEEEGGDEKKVNVGAIVGGAVGGVAGLVLIIIIICLICWCCKKRKKKKDAEDPNKVQWKREYKGDDIWKKRKALYDPDSPAASPDSAVVGGGGAQTQPPARTASPSQAYSPSQQGYPPAQQGYGGRGCSPSQQGYPPAQQGYPGRGGSPSQQGYPPQPSMYGPGTGAYGYPAQGQGGGRFGKY